MKRLWDRSQAEQVDYHLADGRAINFEVNQPARIELARFMIDKLLGLNPLPQTIIELGCGAGDISGPLSKRGHRVFGVDVVPAAQEACAERWPAMEFELGQIENVTPRDCDILILCEVLEHLDDPRGLIYKWLPRAKWVIIGHPLNEPSPPYERGHIWSYTDIDFANWFTEGRHQRLHGETYEFEMGPYHMIMGLGRRL